MTLLTVLRLKPPSFVRCMAIKAPLGSKDVKQAAALKMAEILEAGKDFAAQKAQQEDVYQGAKLLMKPWVPYAKSSNSKFPSASFYSPNDFHRSRRVFTPTPNRSTTSGLGPSTARAKLRDPFHSLSINPLDEYKNATLLGGFVTEMGLIKNRGATGLTRRSQRLVAKAIKRARNAGVIPYFSRPVLGQSHGVW